MYFNLIKKSNNMNQQIMVQTRSENRRKGRSGVIDSVHFSNPNLKEEGSSDTSDEDEAEASASINKKVGVSVPPSQTAKDGTPLL